MLFSKLFITIATRICFVACVNPFIVCLATGCLILLHTPKFLLEIKVIIRIESNSWYPRIYETFEQKWCKKTLIFSNFDNWNFVVSIKVNFSNPPILIFFTKISVNAPWIRRRNSFIWQGCSSTYMVVRLSNKRSF